MKHDSDLQHVSVFRLFAAMLSIAFAIYMVPGLWGAPLKAVSPFAPPAWTQDFNLYTGGVEPKFYDYEAGMAYAKAQNKPVFLDFSGNGCTNCREMETAVWTDPRVKSMLDNDFVLITLMCDEKQSLPQPQTVEDSEGNVVKLKTVGDKWSFLQAHKFGGVSQPFYVIVDTRGNPLAPARAYNKNVEEYLKFMRQGLANFNN
jgi:thiol:disulfide interchange protein DsbD